MAAAGLNNRGNGSLYAEEGVNNCLIRLLAFRLLLVEHTTINNLILDC